VQVASLEGDLEAARAASAREVLAATDAAARSESAAKAAASKAAELERGAKAAQQQLSAVEGQRSRAIFAS
jgi:hypothetical protein